ncbi:MAG: N-acetylglucosamine kinase-like BadF-type ATPase [Planctomycetota bacterium]|jgi:N-acetylglucosamine kinase-like BadF-type ATPase
MQRIAGIDGGGTHTRAAIADETGRVLGIGEAGPGNLHDVGEEQLGKHIQLALERAWAASGETSKRVDALFLGLASVARETERERVRQLVRRLGLASDGHVGIDHDLRIALAGGLGGEAGIALIAGTGSACFGRDADGNSAYAGGWGPFLDDAGSAFELARRGLTACIRAHDGRGPKVAFSQPLYDELQLEDWHQVPARVSSGELSRAQIAQLAPIIDQAAAQGDPIACGLIQDAANELTLLIVAVANKLGWEDPPIALNGGMLAKGNQVRSVLETVLKHALPKAHAQDPCSSPVEGAVMLARDLL